MPEKGLGLGSMHILFSAHIRGLQTTMADCRAVFSDEFIKSSQVSIKMCICCGATVISNTVWLCMPVLWYASASVYTLE